MFKRKQPTTFADSQLYDQGSFYAAFRHDLSGCKKEVILESPFITARRTARLIPIFKQLLSQGVRIVINTKDPREYDDAIWANEVLCVIERLQALEITVFVTGGHHRKLAILDRKILYEGSLNILSQSDSCEIMRRIKSQDMAQQTIRFIGLDNFLR